MSINTDKQLLESEIQRLGANLMVVIEDSEAPEGLEIQEVDRSWNATFL